MNEKKTTRTGPGMILWKVIRVLLLGYLGFAALVYIFQRRLMYYPSSDPVPIPPLPNRAGIREVDLTASDGVSLKAWHWPGTRSLTFLIFHGNAGDRGGRLPWIDALRKIGAGIFILDYRGFGGSGGSPSEKGLYRDAEAAGDWLKANGHSPVVYIGESLGTAVAVELALRRPPAALVLQSPFTSAVELGQKTYPFLPVKLLQWDRYDSLSKIDRIQCPLMVIHGERDSLVPLAMGKTLFERARVQKEWLQIDGFDHNDPFWEDPEYLARLKSFLAPLLAER